MTISTAVHVNFKSQAIHQQPNRSSVPAGELSAELLWVLWRWGQMGLSRSAQRTDPTRPIFVWVEKARLSHFQDIDYCTVAQKVSCSCKTDDMGKLTDASGNHICSRTGLVHAKQDHSQPCTVESTSGYFAQQLHARAALLALPALLWCRSISWEQPAGKWGRTCRGPPLVPRKRWSPA